MVKTPNFSMQGAQIRSLVGELRAHTPYLVVWPKDQNINEAGVRSGDAQGEV